MKANVLRGKPPAHETLTSGHGSWTKCTSSAVGRARCPTLLCRSGQAGPLLGYHYLGGREGAQCQVELRAQTQGPPKSVVSSCTSVKGLQARAREPEEDSSQCTRPEASGRPQGNPAGLGGAQDHTRG